VRLLFDENLSHKLVEILAHDFPSCAHVRDIGFRAAEDKQIWDHARTQRLVIVSKDTDFRERSYVEGFPPKIIGLTSVTQEPSRLPDCSGANVNASTASRNRKKPPCSSCQSGRPRSRAARRRVMAPFEDPGRGESCLPERLVHHASPVPGWRRGLDQGPHERGDLRLELGAAWNRFPIFVDAQ